MHERDVRMLFKGKERSKGMETVLLTNPLVLLEGRGDELSQSFLFLSPHLSKIPFSLKWS